MSDVRYLNTVALDIFGSDFQDKISSKTLLVIGCGGIGNIILDQIVRLGFGKVIVFDDDVVELKNLQRQILFDETSVGKLKVNVAKSRLKKINSDVEVIVYPYRFDYKLFKLLDSVSIDLVFDATDNNPSRFILNDFCISKKIPLVYCSYSSVSGMVKLFDFSVDGGPCLNCLLNGLNVSLSCDEVGVLSSGLFFVSSHSVILALKFFSGLVDEFVYSFNVWTSRFDRFELDKLSSCSVCGSGIDYRYWYCSRKQHHNFQLNFGKKFNFRKVVRFLTFDGFELIAESSDVLLFNHLNYGKLWVYLFGRVEFEFDDKSFCESLFENLSSL